MISSIKGDISKILKDSIIIENSIGMGYEVNCNDKTIGNLIEGQSVKMLIHTHITQDDIKLFGFLDDRDLNLFKMLIPVSGVGPRMALSILEVSPEDFALAIVENNVTNLTKIKGIGKKTAERLIVELKANIKSFASDISSKGDISVLEEAKYALLSLGFNASSVELALEECSETKTVEDLIKLALIKLHNK